MINRDGEFSMRKKHDVWQAKLEAFKRLGACRDTSLEKQRKKVLYTDR